LGEDGPTHQSVEHAAALRLIPGMDVWRPCDTVESAAAWIAAIERGDGPTTLLFTRQNVPFQKRDAHTIAAIRRGGYVLSDAQEPKAVIIATGSEVQLAMGAKKKLGEEGVAVRVVSMPCTSVFDRQPPMYKDIVLIPTLPRVAVEAGVSDTWRKYLGLEGAVVGIDRYGESAPGPKLFEYFGFTVDNVVKAVKSVLH
jgi:transketolase